MTTRKAYTPEWIQWDTERRKLLATIAKYDKVVSMHGEKWVRNSKKHWQVKLKNLKLRQPQKYKV
mgnify:CR=1 FL=1